MSRSTKRVGCSSWTVREQADSINTGHALIVMAEPRRNAQRPDEVLVELADATESPHASDHTTEIALAALRSEHPREVGPSR